MKISAADMQANFAMLQDALKSVNGDKFASASVKDVSVVSNDEGLKITFNAVVDGVETPVVLSLSPELEPPDGTADGETVGGLLGKLDNLDAAEMSPDQAVAFLKALFEGVVDKIQAEGLKSTIVPAGGGTDGNLVAGGTSGGPQAPGRLTSKPGPVTSSSPSDPKPTDCATLFNLMEILSLIVRTAQELKKSAKNLKAADNEQQAQAYEQQASKTLAMAQAAKTLGDTYTAISACMLAVSAFMTIGAGTISAAKGFLADTKVSGVSAGMSKSVLTGGEPDMAQVTTPQAQKAVQNLGATPEARQARVDAIRQDFANDPGIARTKEAYGNAVNALEGMPADAPGRADAQANVARTKAEFIGAVEAVKSKYDSDFVAAPKETATQKEADMIVANEFAMKTLKDAKVSVGQGEAAVQRSILSENDCAKITSGYDKAYRSALKDENHYALAATGSAGTFLGQLGQTLNQHWQSQVSYKAQADSASAQKEQANASRKQNDYEESKNLEDAAQSVIDAARQTMQKAYESQRQATQEIFS
jgi:hypothetical protein